jgi:glycerol dehydrogenase
MTYGMKTPYKYVQGEGELANLGKNAKKMGNKFLVLCSPNNKKRVGNIIEESLKSVEKEVVFCEFGGECSKAEINHVMEVAQENGCDIIVGVGGGKAIDTAKAACTNLGGWPLIVIPTVASNDSPCSGVAVIYNDEGVVIKALMMKHNPDLVLVDTNVIAASPKRLLVCGMGDALSTWFEARACKNSGAKNMARGLCSNTALMMSRLCYDLLLQNGVEALKALDEKKPNAALDNIVEASIYLSGVGFECGGLAAAHAINDGFAYVPQAHGMYHGEKVAFGTLTQLVLEKAPKEEMDEVLAFMKSVGLPMTLADLGITDVKEEEIRKVAEAACVPTQSTKNLRADITPDEVYEAIMEADRIGTAYKKA